VLGVQEMYDDLSANYDRFVNWPGRLAVELPFLERQLHAVDALRVLDVACATGQHAIALARRGYAVVGADLSAGMIGQARANATEARVAGDGIEGGTVHFEVAGFGELTRQVGTGFDALLCLGNSLPHLLTPAELAQTLQDFVACLQPGGLLLIQNRDFDRVLALREQDPTSDKWRWMEPQAHQDGEAEWLFLRFYDAAPDGSLTFNVVTLHREGPVGWNQHVTTTRLWPQTHHDLRAALAAAGFGQITAWGDMQGEPFSAGRSPNLVLTARRAR
jgi:glycine/sarcosine N-methyltransferase